ncbi:MAG: SurA N-terminal domain-containing protein [Sphaerochaetaceae bacterium]|jgi:parvulin-like peptidyl-prolyl isomerase|nr:SurA N-terminal domain-containing protein [Sphaerochaetaceae bacterium]
MPSKDSQTPGKDDSNVVKFAAKDEKKTDKPKKKGSVTVTQIVTYVILGLLAIVLVVGVFPSFGSQGGPSSVAFGSYDGTPIEFAFGNYFYRQYQNQAQQNKATGQSAAYQIWRAAFESTVFHTAMMKKAEKAGIRVVDETVNQAIIDSGIYNKDGKFDVATYEQTSVERKNQIKVQYTESLPVQMVVEDVATVLTAPAEIEYVVGMGDNARAFTYAVFDASLYPDDLTKQYAMANPANFTLIDISVITVSDAQKATDLRNAIVSGSVSFEEAAKADSLDTFGSEGGKAGTWYLYELQDNFTNPEEVNVLFSTPAGEVSQVFASPGGSVIYRVERSPFLADFEDTEVLGDVKTYIGLKDAQIVETYLQQQATDFAALAATEDFAALAEAKKLITVEVDATPLNVGASNYLAGFAYSDASGYLNSLSADVDAMRSLYGAAVGSVTGPFKANNAYVVAKVVSESPMEEGMRDYMKLIYPYMAQSQSQQDLVQSIFTSDKLQDDFLVAFMRDIMGM